jgi:hypothetical protein
MFRRLIMYRKLIMYRDDNRLGSSRRSMFTRAALGLAGLVGVARVTSEQHPDRADATAAAFTAGGSITDWVNAATHYGADPTGAVDSTNAIQTALNAAAYQGTVFLPSGSYLISAPLAIPSGVRLHGNHGRFPAADQPGDGGSVIAASPAFEGPAMIRLTDAATYGYSKASGEQELADLTLDGTAIKSARATDGINATGRVTGVYLHDVCLYNIPNHGISPGYNKSGNPFSWRLYRVVAFGAGGTGFNVANFTDSTFLDCEAIACGGDGWYIDGNGGCLLTACRAEWNGGHGFHLMGGRLPNVVFTGCSTDSNNWSGFKADAGGGYGAIMLSGCRFGRDGRNGGSGGGGYAGVDIEGTSIQVLIDGCFTYVARDDDAAGPYRPQYGISIRSASYVQVRGGIWWGVTAGWHAGGGNTVVRRSGVDVAVGRDSLLLSTPATAAGSDAGTSAPGPVCSREANDEHGAVMFGTGRNPGAGQQCTVTFSVPFAGTPAVTITSQNEATVRLQPYVSATADGFSIMTANAPAAAQDNSTYSVAWIVRG